MPVPDGGWNGPAFQYTVQADYIYGYNGAPPCAHQEVNTYAGEASQFMALRPPQTDCNTASLVPMWQHGMEYNRIESAGCAATHASNNNDTFTTLKTKKFHGPENIVVEGDTPINYWQMDRGIVVWNDNISPLNQPVRDNKLADIEPDA